jgi:hypothetical protein
VKGLFAGAALGSASMATDDDMNKGTLRKIRAGCRRKLSEFSEQGIAEAQLIISLK